MAAAPVHCSIRQPDGGRHAATEASLDQPTRRAIIDGVEDETEGRSIEDLTRARNAALLRLLAVDRTV